ncbi:hypothetical protein HHL22_03850 [Hymenobacter sp. RP-2-7]|uniref:Uncharacterized protein n=1 Tax=Hymenobacter polaris TaxID=2682546 RepID=A0A7Y0FL07_9BACT|nr:hypothetical protein [Hymenobacter polaris]NML64332.1 hypothetical protein [Hymenobacter polaris]
MSLDTYSPAFLDLAYRPDLHQLTGRWQYSTTDAEMHQGYDALRRAALHYNCGNWLIDSRRCLNRCLSRLVWVTDRCLPQVQRELGTPLRIGFLVLPDYLNGLPASASVPVPDAAVRMTLFIDEGAAGSWLAQQQRELASR